MNSGDKMPAFSNFIDHDSDIINELYRWRERYIQNYNSKSNENHGILQF